MKKVLYLSLILFSSVLIYTGCASLDSNPKKMACKRACSADYDSCSSSAGGDSKEGLKCEAKKAACLKGCDEL